VYQNRAWRNAFPYRKCNASKLYAHSDSISGKHAGMPAARAPKPNGDAFQAAGLERHNCSEFAQKSPAWGAPCSKPATFARHRFGARRRVASGHGVPAFPCCLLKTPAVKPPTPSMSCPDSIGGALKFGIHTHQWPPGMGRGRFMGMNFHRV
jgi:hypothetical protein